MITGIKARKLGIISQFNNKNGSEVAVTVLEILPHTIIEEKPNGNILIATSGNGSKKLMRNKSHQGNLKKHGIDIDIKNKNRFYEYYSPECKKIIKYVSRNGEKTFGVNIFENTKKVDVQGISKGKGFSGVMKLHNMKGQCASHGNSKSHRAAGSTGWQDTSRVQKGQKMAGRGGGRAILQRGLAIYASYPEDNILLVLGSVPGVEKSIVEIKPQI